MPLLWHCRCMVVTLLQVQLQKFHRGRRQRQVSDLGTDVKCSRNLFVFFLTTQLIVKNRFLSRNDAKSKPWWMHCRYMFAYFHFSAACVAIKFKLFSNCFSCTTSATMYHTACSRVRTTTESATMSLKMT